MKSFLLLPILACSLAAFAQNTKPIVSIQNVSVDQTQQKVNISYQLTDAQNQSCEVWLKISTDGGDFYQQIAASALTGDIGNGIAPGPIKNLVWDYSAQTGNIFNTKIKLYASDNQAVSISDMVSEVDSNSLRSNLEYVEGIRNVGTTAGLAHLNEVRDSIQANFNRDGLTTEQHNFIYNTKAGMNILGRKTGAKDEAITYIMDAHYDGVPNAPAADDNGSGVVGVLEAAKILSKYEFEHSIRFIGFDFEEAGLIGSQKYVQTGIKTYEDIQGVLNYEMIGYYDNSPNSQSIPAGFSTLFPQTTQAIINDSSRGNFLFVCGNTASAALSTSFLNYVTQYVPNLKAYKADVPGTGTIAPDLRRSDHAPFWDTGKKALMLTDGADFRNHHYHTPGDSIGTLNFTFMSNVVKATLATIAELAVPISAGYDGFDLAVLSSNDHHHAFPAKIEVYPNPSNGKLNLKVTSENAIKTRIEIFDLNGKIVWSKITDFAKGDNLQTYQLSDLAAGNYMMVITSDEHTFSQGIVLSK